MAVTIQVWISESQGATHVQARGLGDTADECERAIKLFPRLAGGSPMFVRQEPIVETQTDFETQTVRYGCFARFSILEENQK